MRLVVFSVLLAGMALSRTGAAEAATGPQHSDLQIFVAAARGELEIRFKGKPLLLYAFATNQFKPYVKKLYTLGGQNVLLDAPVDHLHHHGLMYAIRVNDVNFWEEVGEPGHERPVKLLSHKTGNSASGLPQASFSQLIHWVAHTNATVANTAGVALLIETRTIVVTIDEAQDQVALNWRSDFELGSAREQASLTGSAYNGLGLRFPRSFDHGARHQNSENLPYTAEAKWDVTPAKWSAVNGSVDGHDATIALFGQPSNKGETRFFTMLNPFAYLAVTQNLEKQPIEYTAGDKFSIRYLLILYPGRKNADFVNARYAQWLRDPK